MSIGGDDEAQESKTVPKLSEQQKKIASGKAYDDSAVEESQIYNKGENYDELKKKAQHKEADRAEKFRDHFERISILSMWFLFGIFSLLTGVWALNLILSTKCQFLDSNQEDKLQLIITGGFVAGIASSHIKKRLGKSD